MGNEYFVSFVVHSEERSRFGDLTVIAENGIQNGDDIAELKSKILQRPEIWGGNWSLTILSITKLPVGD